MSDLKKSVKEKKDANELFPYLVEVGDFKAIRQQMKGRHFRDIRELEAFVDSNIYDCWITFCAKCVFETRRDAAYFYRGALQFFRASAVRKERLVMVDEFGRAVKPASVVLTDRFSNVLKPRGPLR